MRIKGKGKGPKFQKHQYIKKQKTKSSKPKKPESKSTRIVQELHLNTPLPYLEGRYQSILKWQN